MELLKTTPRFALCSPETMLFGILGVQFKFSHNGNVLQKEMVLWLCTCKTYLFHFRVSYLLLLMKIFLPDYLKLVCTSDIARNQGAFV